MQSRLVTVELACDILTIGQSSSVPHQDPRNDPLYLLRRSQETLERMEVTLPIALRQGFCYPNLVELDITCTRDLPVTWTYICAFPRLEDLAVNFGGEFSPERTPITFGCRQWNIAEQRRLGTWTSLSRVHGKLEDLFLLGLTCAIPELTMSILWLNLDNADLMRCEADAWRQILAYARPSRVTLHIDDSDWIVRDHGFALLTETPQLVSLQSLHFVVRVSYCMGRCPESLGHINGPVVSPALSCRHDTVLMVPALTTSMLS